MTSAARSRVHRRLLARSAAALPTGEPVRTAAGPDPDRVLVIGSGPVGGAGTTSHDDALPGLLSRALAARTCRGAVVEARGMPHARLADLPALVGGAQLQRFDALVLVVGMADAATGAGVRRWTRDLQHRLDVLQRDGARDAVVLLTRIPPIASVLGRPGLDALLADARVSRMNRALERLARARPAAALMPLPVPCAEAPVGSPAWYGRCAEALADALAPLLAKQHR